MKNNYGDLGAIDVSGRIASPVATVAAIKAIPADRRIDGMKLLLTLDGSRWRFSSASALTGDDVLTISPTAGSGAWLREPGSAMLALPITYATADAAVLLTVPTGCILQPVEFGWRIDTSFTGGSSSAIGVSSGTKSGYTTKGDLLGGASGDVLAGLTTALSPTLGTIGAGFDTLAKRRKLLVATDTIRYDRITSVFTAGAGAVLFVCHVLQHNGA